MAGSNFWVFTGSSPWNIPRKQMETSLLQHPQSWGRFLHEELTACCKYCTYSMDKWWTWAFSRFFFFNFATFAGLELIPFKTTTPKTFLFPAVMFPFLYPERKKQKETTLVCSWPGTESVFFFWGIVHLPRRQKNFIFQVEKQGVSSWSDLSSCWLLSEAQNASHLNISRCRRKFLRQQLLKCAILTFLFFFS